MRLLSVSTVARTMMQCTTQAALRRLKEMAKERPGLLRNVSTGKRKTWKVDVDVLKLEYPSLKESIAAHDELLETHSDLLRGLAKFVGYQHHMQF